MGHSANDVCGVASFGGWGTTGRIKMTERQRKRKGENEKLVFLEKKCNRDFRGPTSKGNIFLAPLNMSRGCRSVERIGRCGSGKGAVKN